MRDAAGVCGIAASTAAPYWLAVPLAGGITFVMVYRRLRYAKYEVLSGSLLRRRRR